MNMPIRSNSAAATTATTTARETGGPQATTEAQRTALLEKAGANNERARGMSSGQGEVQAPAPTGVFGDFMEQPSAPSASPPARSPTEVVAPPKVTAPAEAVGTPPSVAPPVSAAPPEARNSPPVAEQPGLEVGAPGFPAGAVRTPGGYTIVAEGKDQAWSVYGPGQQFGDEPLSRTWGDPHVKEADGTKWDFTKDSNFRLPDGTVIRCDTTAETGQSYTNRLDILMGNDRVSITGIDNHQKAGLKPTVTKHTDGEAWIAEHATALQSSATFSLQHGGGSVSWTRFSNGQVDGVVTGGHFDKAMNSYVQEFGGKQPGDKAMGGLGFLNDPKLIQQLLSRIESAIYEMMQQGKLNDLLAAARSGRRV